MTNDAAAACQGEPRLCGDDPQLLAGVGLERELGVLHDLVDHLGGHGGVDAPAHVHAAELGRLALGAAAERRGAPPRARAPSARAARSWRGTRRPPWRRSPRSGPATPARRTIEPPGLAPAMPSTRETLVTRPSLIAEDGRPGPAAPDVPVVVGRQSRRARARSSPAVSVVRRPHAGSVPQRNQTLTSEEHTMTTIVDGVDAFHELVGKELGHSRVADDHPGAGEPLRRRDRRPPVDPRRPRAGQGRALRRGHRPRVPDPVAGPGPAEQDHPGRQHEVRRELRLQQGPLPLAGARSAPSCAWA